MSKIIDNMDVEMKALAKAFVNTALEKGYDVTEINRIVKDIKEELVLESSKETRDEQEFRVKAMNFAKSNKELGEEKIVTEMICVMYTMFDLPRVQQKEIVEKTYRRVCIDVKKSTSRVEIAETYKRLKKFCIVSAFQKYVTTRKDSLNSGGTGLTTLIKALIDKSDAHYCYAISGNTMIKFIKKYLNLTEDGLIGFNEKNNYICNIPSKESISKTTYDINANIYNLQFILKEDKDGKKYN